MDAAANELNARLRADAARLAMETAARTQMANDEAQLARETLQQRSAESALDRALRGREIGVDLRELRDPSTGNLVGRSFGRSVQWNTPERELDLEVVVDPSTGKRIGVQDQFGRLYRDPKQSLFDQARERASLGLQTNTPPSALSVIQSANAAPKKFIWDGGKLIPQ
jgi:hypothetical protein